MLRKRTMIAVMALAMLILVMSNAVFAESQLTVTAGKTEINKGTTTASVTLMLSGNPGIAGMGVDVGYRSDVMTLESVELSEDVFEKGDVIPVEIKNPYTYSTLAFSTLSNKTTNGLLATFNFKVNADCPAGVYPIELTNGDALNIDGNDVAITLVNVSITVNDPFAGMAAKVVKKDGSETGYATLPEALSAAVDGDTVTLLKDVTYDGDGSTYRRGIIDGGNYTLTLKKRILVGDIGNLTLKNIKVDLSQFSDSNTAKQDAFVVYSKTLTFEDGVIITGAAGNLSNVVRVAGATSVFNMTGGSIEDCSVNYAVVRIHDNDGSKATISGGSIKNNAVLDLRGALCLEQGTLTITGNPEITGNVNNNSKAFNVNIKGGTFNVEAPFTGKIGVRLNDGGDKGTVIGNAVAGLTLESVDSVVCDYDDTLFAYVSGTDLILTKKLTLTPETDQGRYTKTGDTATYGVVRVNTTVTEVPLAESVEEMGTYFYKTTNNGPLDVVTSGPNYFKLKDADMTDLASGKGYTADLVDITGETATVYAVNFYRLKGIDGYVFEALAPVEYVKENAKNLGKDPVQLKDN